MFSYSSYIFFNLSSIDRSTSLIWNFSILRESKSFKSNLLAFYRITSSNRFIISIRYLFSSLYSCNYTTNLSISGIVLACNSFKSVYKQYRLSSKFKRCLSASASTSNCFTHVFSSPRTSVINSTPYL